MNRTHIPNILSISRLILILPFIGFLYQHEYKIVLYIFLLAGFTDALDGWLARQFHWQSIWGSRLDATADKLLICVSFVTLAILGKLSWWLVILVFLRDITISFGALAWFWLIQYEFSFTPTFISKINTTLQLGLVALCLFELALVSLPWYFLETLTAATALTTTWSYIDYVWTWGKKAYAAPYASKVNRA